MTVAFTADCPACRRPRAGAGDPGRRHWQAAAGLPTQRRRAELDPTTSAVTRALNCDPQLFEIYLKYGKELI